MQAARCQLLDLSLSFCKFFCDIYFSFYDIFYVIFYVIICPFYDMKTIFYDIRPIIEVP